MLLIITPYRAKINLIYYQVLSKSVLSEEPSQELEAFIVVDRRMLGGNIMTTCSFSPDIP